MIGARGAGRVPARHVFFFAPKRRIVRNRASRGGLRAGASRSPQQARLDHPASNLSALAFVSKAKKPLGEDSPAPADFPFAFFVVLLCCCFVVFFCSFPVSLVALLRLLQPNGLGQNAKGKTILFWPAGKSARFAQISHSKPTLPPVLGQRCGFPRPRAGVEIGLPSAARRPAFPVFPLFGPLSLCLPNGAASPFEPPAF